MAKKAASKTKKAPAAPTPEATPKQIDRIADEIMSGGKVDLVADGSEKTGASSLGHKDPDEIQMDYLRGTRTKDRTYIPEFVFDEGIQAKRRATLPTDYKYGWIQYELTDRYNHYGWKFCRYSGGGQGMEDGGFDGTGLYTKTPEGYVRNGDCLLMFTPMRNWREILQEEQVLKDKWTRGPLDDFHNVGDKAGVKTFEDDTKRGVREFS